MKIPETGSLLVENNRNDNLLKIASHLRALGRMTTVDQRTGPWKHFAWNKHSMWWCEHTTNMPNYYYNDIMRYVNRGIDNKYPTELIKNKIYKHLNGAILRWDVYSYIGPQNNGVYKTDNGFWSTDVTEYVTASPEEQEWLLVCERENKFIKYDDRYLYPFETKVNKTPEFTKDRWYESDSTGNIYKCREVNHNGLNWSAIFNFKTKTIEYRNDSSNAIHNFDPKRWILEEDVLNRVSNSDWKKKDFADTKIFLSNEKESIKLQNLLFKLGFKWLLGNGKPEFTKKPYLYIEKDSSLSHGADSEFFHNESPGNKEILYTDIFPEVNESITYVTDRTILVKVRNPITDNKNKVIHIYTKPQPHVVEPKKNIKLKVKQIKLIQL